MFNSCLALVALTHPIPLSCKGSLTIEKARAANLSWKTTFQEIPVTVHNNALATALAATISPASYVSSRDADRLTLAAAPVLERNLEFLNDCLDDVVVEQNKLGGYHTAVRRQQQAIAAWRAQRRQENATRRSAGEDPLSEEPPEGMFKMPTEPGALEGMLLLTQMSGYCEAIDRASTQAIQRLVVAESLQQQRL